MSREIDLAWVLPDISHYHHARIDAFARAAGRPGGVAVVCAGGVSGFREFRCPDDRPRAYALATLFPGCYYRGIPPRALRRALTKHLAELQPRALLIQGWAQPHALIPLEWGVASGVPCVVTSESQESDERRLPWREAVKRRVVRLFGAGLVGGRPHASYLASLGMAPACAFTGYDVVDNAHFAAGAGRARARAAAERARLGLPDRYFLASGRMVEKKNHAFLVRAYAEFARRTGGSDWRLVIVGDGERRSALERLVGELGLGDRVRMPGFLGYDDLPACYGLAGALIHPSTQEQWGLVVNEAMACGLPVLVSDRCGCAPDLVQPGGNGFAFPADDPEPLVRRMVELAGDGDLRSRLGAASAARIAEWTPERFAAGLAAALATARSAPRAHLSPADRLLLRMLSWR